MHHRHPDRRRPVIRSLAWLATLLVTAALTTNARADEFRLPSLISDHMVLQRDSTVPIWGWVTPGAEVTVRANWGNRRPVLARANADGRWEARLRTPDAGGPYRIQLQSGAHTHTIHDVLIGEVWVCSGQSNMEWRVRQSADPEKEAKAAQYPEIRFFTVPNVVSHTPRDTCDGNWSVCAPETTSQFSAVGYYFGRTLHRKLGVPIGLISADWGGTPAESWTDEPALRRLGDFDAALDRLATLREDPSSAERAIEQARVKWYEAVDAADPEPTGRGWMHPELDDSDWETTTLPAAWSGELGRFDGTVWYRRTVTIPDAWAGRPMTIELGPIDDMDVVWLNGVEVGATRTMGHWQRPRRYTVPAHMTRAGTAVLTVLVLDQGGAGGLTGKPEQVRIGSRDGRVEEHLMIAGPWRMRRGVAWRSLPPMPRNVTINAHTPSSLFNGMIAPILPYGMRGVIWYQGESNRTRAAQYRRLFPAMIGAWRRAWGQGDFPFYFVQIAPFAYGGDSGQAAALREAQFMTLRNTPNTGMAVTMDIGNPRDIHPRNKQDVGDRLARWALAKTYGIEGVAYTGPLYRSMTVEGRSIRLAFDGVGSGLEARDGALTHFTIAGADQQFVAATAEIDGDTIVVSSPEVSSPVAVRYGWGAADEPNLFNRDGLPASSFRTDDWN